MEERRKKKGPLLLITLAAVAALVIGFGWLDLLTVNPQPTDSPASAPKSALTVRVFHPEGAALYDLAAQCTVNGTVVGSRSGEKKTVPRGTEQAEAYDFAFRDGDLPAGPLSSLRLDFYAVEKPGVDYTLCGSAVIQAPEIGGVYMLALYGDFSSGLCIALDEANPSEAIELIDAGI